jgi:hypothetical protein
VSLLVDIRDTADRLTEPYVHSEPIVHWDTNRNRKIKRHRTLQPGLLAQLYQAVVFVASGDSVAGGLPGSRPPLAVEALSRHDTISMAALRWCTSLGLATRVSAESNIRALVGAAGGLDSDTARVLLAEMRQWLRWCLVMTGWESVYRPAGVPCIIVDCGQVNTLRINLTTRTAMCQACESTWTDEDGALGVLAEYIRLRTDRVTRKVS